MRLGSILQRVFRQLARPALTSKGIALEYGIEKLDIVPGASRRLAALQARATAASMTEAELEAHVQVFGTPAQKELMAAIREQRTYK